jgi:hypothetical protein
MTQSRRGSPEWLKDRWADRKKATVTRITGAVAHLKTAGDMVTYASICRSVELLYGVSISANTIKRNEEAYEVYSTHRSSRHLSPAKELALQSLAQNTPGEHRNRLRSRIARLRRLRKDALIARLLQLEDASDRQKMIETNLRDEVLRLLARAKAGAQ